MISADLLNTVSFKAPFEEKPLTLQVARKPHLVLMRPVLDDRFGNEEKPNLAASSHHIHTGADGAKWRSIAFDTAMNVLPGEFYFRIANVKKIALVIEADAKIWRARLMRRVGGARPVVVAETEKKGNGKAVLRAELSKSPERFYLELTFQGEIELAEVAWTTAAPKELPPLGLSITTYNKPEHLLPNLELLSKSASFRDGLLDVLVVNNGNALENVPEGVEVMPKNNIGGTGGFLTGYEHFKAKGYAHFVIMDDDIVISPGFVDRVFALSCLAKGHHIGSLAEILNTKDRIVKEQGGKVSRENVFGLDLLHPMTDLSRSQRLSLYGFYPMEFSGWWSLLVDLSAPTPTIPQNQFIKRDDIMFGLESEKEGYPTIVFPNLIVAHGEEGAPTYYYYDIRNDLIMRARNNKQFTLSLKQLAKISAMLMLTLRSDRQKMFNKALRDFMAGPKALAKTDIAKTLGDVRKLAHKATPLPENAPELSGGTQPSIRELARGFFSPRAWKAQDTTPIVHDNPLRHAMSRKRYYEPLPFADTGFLRERKLILVPRFIVSVWLLTLLAVRRKGLVRQYQREAK